MSLVRENLMKEKGYAPYCGNDDACFMRWPRTKFDGKQFVCSCRWKSDFPEWFIKMYKSK